MGEEKEKVGLAPTIVIGVGEAGIKMEAALYNLVKEEGAEEYFKFVAMDSNEEDMNKHTPSGIEETIHLEKPHPKKVEEDKEKWNYLYDEVDFGGLGVIRQRVLARYLIDNELNYDTVRDTLTDIINGFVGRHKDILTGEIKTSLNIWLLHSLGGGTGSGTFPLLAFMISAIKSEIKNKLKVTPFIGGVGCLSSVPEDIVIGRISGDPIYYANALAAMMELKKMMAPEGLEIPLYAKGEKRIKIEGFPFDKYFFLGINEHEIGETKTEYVESYIEEKNNFVANSIFSLHKYSGELWNWRKGDFLGSFGEREVGAPIERIRDYVDLKDEQERLAKELEEIKKDIESKKSRIETLNSVSNDPNKLQEKLKEDIRARVEGEIVGTGLAKVSEDELEIFFEGIKKDLDLEGGRFVVEVLDEKTDDAPYRSEWVKKVNTFWERHGALKNENIKVKSIEDKHKKLIEWLEKEIKNTIKWIKRPPKARWPGELGKRKENLEKLREEERKLKDTKDELDNVVKLKGKNAALRDKIISEISNKRNGLEAEKNSLEDEKRREEEEIGIKEGDISGKEEELSKSKFGRIGYLTVKNLDKLTKAEFDSIGSLKELVDKGYIKKGDVKKALKTQVDRAKDWSDIAPTQPGKLDLFILRNEDNIELVNLLSKSDKRGFTSKEYSIKDKWMIKVCVYKSGIDIEKIQEYENLKGQYDKKELSEILGEEVGKAFAYPEWFTDDENVMDVFEKMPNVAGSKSAEMPKKEEKPQPHISTKKITDGGRILVDGSNVAWESKKDGKPNIDNIEIIRSELEKKGYNNPITIVDANLRHIIPEIDKERFERWIEEEKKVIQTPAGIKADEELLKFADEDENELKIVSNDTFRGSENEYPWLNDPSRRVPFRIIENRAILHFR